MYARLILMKIVLRMSYKQIKRLARDNIHQYLCIRKYLSSTEPSLQMSKNLVKTKIRIRTTLTGNTIRSNESLAASSRSTSATNLAVREARISSLSSTEAPIKFALALGKVSMIITASISSEPSAMGTRI